MLAHSVMNVVFVPDETINQGTRKGDGKKRPKYLYMAEFFCFFAAYSAAAPGGGVFGLGFVPDMGR